LWNLNSVPAITAVEEATPMKGLSLVELVALLFAGIAGLASAVQAYVSWETRGEVSRAIVFAQRIDACAKVIAAVEPFVAKARPESRRSIASSTPDGRHSLPRYYYGQSSGNPEFDAKHAPSVQKWREASAAFLIVSPTGGADHVKYFDQVITENIPAGRFMKQAELLEWLERLDTKAHELTTICRKMI
jgi:hypothetical protein